MLIQWTLALVCLVHANNATFLLGGDETSVEKMQDPTLLADELKTFIKATIEEPFRPYCFGHEEYDIKMNELLVRNAPCHEEGAIKRYSFDGQFVDGKINGTGILNFSPESPEQQRCLMIKANVFDLPSPDVIEGHFDRGIMYGIANLTWHDLAIRMNAHVTYGLMHGMFKAYNGETKAWMISRAIRNKISDQCWLVLEDDDEVWRGQCLNMFQMELAKFPLHIFSLNMTSLMYGLVDANAGQLLFQDAILTSVHPVHQCDISFDHILHGLPFQYDLETRERKMIDKISSAELCNVSQIEDPSVVLRNYFDQVKPTMLEDVPIDHQLAIQFLTNIKKVENAKLFEAVLNWNSPSEIIFEYFGKLDQFGQFHGAAFLDLHPMKTCLKGTCHELNIGTIRGTFQHGILNGLVTMTSIDSYQITYLILQDGIAHGIVPTYGMKVLSKIPQKEDYKFAEHDQMISQRYLGIGQVVKYVNGHLSRSQAWIGLVAQPRSLQGYLHGNMDIFGAFDGDDNAYIYPGGKLALVGKFKNNIMVSAQEAKITELNCQHGLLTAEFQRTNNDQVYHQSIGNFSSVGDLPLVPDPYEAMTVYLDKSTYPGVVGHGLFAKRDIKEGEILAFYNGYQVLGAKEKEANIDRCRTRLAQDPALDALDIHRACFKYAIHKSTFGGLMDLPPWLDDIQVYNATLAHKVNHKFEPLASGAFFNMEHPRFGTIVGVFAIKDIKANDEIFVNYGYNVKAVAKHAPWYVEMYEKHQELMKNNAL